MPRQSAYLARLEPPGEERRIVPFLPLNDSVPEATSGLERPAPSGEGLATDGLARHTTLARGLVARQPSPGLSSRWG